MPCIVNPTVVVTRPQENSEQFVQALEAVAGPFDALICPAFEFSATAVQMPNFDIAVFTSRAGVMFAPDGMGRLAYCVGAATAFAAKEAGYTVKSADGAAEDLVHLILEARPTGRLLHVRGETSVGDVKGRLYDGGLHAAEIVAYRKVIVEREAFLAKLGSFDKNAIIPLFSAETVSILAEMELDFTATHTVAISPAVAEAAEHLLPATMTIAAAPNQVEMVAAVARLIA